MSPSSDGLGCNEEIPEKEYGEEVEDEEEEEGECSTPHCKQPMANQISWVQCDHCQEWFHCICVGLTKEYAEKIDSYICQGCQSISSTGTGQGQGGVVRGGGGGGVSGGDVKMDKTVVTKPLSGGTINSATSCLMKGLLQSPQLAAQLLNTSSFK